LPELVSQGVVPSEVADSIRRYYGEPEAAGSTAKRWAIILFSILGSLLIGGGIILLLAHNWEELSRAMRTVISVLPLVISAGLGGWLLYTKRPSIAWREGVGTAQTLAIGSSIALVSQTYNLGGRLDEFMLTWSLLALPVAYLLGATIPALLYLIGITVWTGAMMFRGAQALWYFPLLALALPYLWWTSRPTRYHPRPVWFVWVLAITVCIASGTALERVCGEFKTWPALYGGLFGLLFLIGSRWWGEAPAAWQRPLQNIGALGAVGLSLVLSFSNLWKRVRWGSLLEGTDAGLAALELTVVALIAAAASVLWVQSWARRAWHEVMIGALPALACIAWAFALQRAAPVAAALFNFFLFALGIGTLTIGMRGRRLGVVNAGMLVLAAVILCRFFDANLGFALRGVAFILIGIGFLVTNAVLLRWKGAVK
jgi:uncharacterized membrane protein